MAMPDAVGALRERTFRPLYYAQVTSVLGDNIAPVALAFAVLHLNGSPSDLGLVLAARTLPMVALVIPAGVWADRFGRQWLMIGSDIVSFASQGVLAALLILGDAQLWHLIALQAVYGTAAAFFLPASSGLVPETVSPARLQQANALIGLSFGAASVVGPLVAGVVVVVAGAGWAIALDALTFAASAIFLSRLRSLEYARPPRTEPFFTQLAAGWREVRSRSWAWVSIADFGLFQFFVLGFFFVLGPVVAEQSLGGASAWAVIVAALGLGSIAGSGLALRLEPRRPLVAVFVASLAFAPALVLLGVAAPLVAVAGAWAIAGAAMLFSQTLWETTLQEKIPAEARSRVSAYDWLGSLALRPLGFAAAGPLAALFGVKATLWLAASALVLFTLATLRVPSVREVERTRHEVRLKTAQATDA